MEMENKQSQNELQSAVQSVQAMPDINADQQLNESADFQKFLEEFVPELETLSAENDLKHEQSLLKIQSLKRENVELTSSQTDLGRQLCHLLRKIEIKSLEDNSDFVSKARSLVSKSKTFENVEILQEQNQILLTSARELTKFLTFKNTMDLANFVRKVENYEENWRQYAMQLQKVRGDLIETLKLENETLQNENVLMKDIVKSYYADKSVRDASICKIQLQLQECKKEWLTLGQDFMAYSKQNSEQIKFVVNQFNVIRKETTKLTENNRKLIADIKIHKENTASQLVEIQSLEKHNEDLKEVFEIQQTNIASYLEHIHSLEKQKKAITKHTEDLSEELLIEEAKITSCLEQINFLEKQVQTEHYKDLAEEVKIEKAKIVSYLQMVTLLEELNLRAKSQNECLTNEIAKNKQKLRNDENHRNHKTAKSVPLDEIAVTAIGTKSKRPNNQAHFNEPPTKIKKFRSQVIGDAVNTKLKRPNNREHFDELPTKIIKLRSDAIGTESKRPNNQEHFDEPPTKIKKFRSQVIGDAVNTKSKRPNSRELFDEPPTKIKKYKPQRIGTKSKRPKNREHFDECQPKIKKLKSQRISDVLQRRSTRSNTPLTKNRPVL